MSHIDDYVNQFSELRKAWIYEYTELMKSKHPCLEATIWLRMPTYKINNAYIAFSATKNYFAVHTNDTECFSMLKEGLDKATFGKRSARIKYSDDGAKHVIYNVIEFFCFKNQKPEIYEQAVSAIGKVLDRAVYKATQQVSSAITDAEVKGEGSVIIFPQGE